MSELCLKQPKQLALNWMFLSALSVLSAFCVQKGCFDGYADDCSSLLFAEWNSEGKNSLKYKLKKVKKKKKP